MKISAYGLDRFLRLMVATVMKQWPLPEGALKVEVGNPVMTEGQTTIPVTVVMKPNLDNMEIKFTLEDINMENLHRKDVN